LTDLPIISPRERQIIADVLRPYALFINTVGIFGSRAMGNSRPSSDIDMVLYGILDDSQIERIWTLFDNSPMAVTVDVLDYRTINHPPLKRHIDAVMKPLFQKTDLLEAA
jgi:uncharacterized protein